MRGGNFLACQEIPDEQDLADNSDDIVVLYVAVSFTVEVLEGERGLLIESTVIDSIQKINEFLNCELGRERATYELLVMREKRRLLSYSAPPTPNKPIDFLNY